MVLGMMLVFAIAVGSVAFIVGSTQSSAERDVARERALSLAEAGLNNALSILSNAADPSSPSALTARSMSTNGGTEAWSGTLSGSTWS